nr:hypothetical protein [Methanobrevibacter arboriphilus]
MKIIEIIEKNLITIISAVFIALPLILGEVAKYVPVEYSSTFGLFVLIVGKIYQANNFDTINRPKAENEENIKDNGDIESSEENNIIDGKTGTQPLSPKYEISKEELEENDFDLSEETSDEGGA